MKLNDKCHLIISGHKPAEVMWEKTGQTKIWESKKQKLILGVIIFFIFNWRFTPCKTEQLL